MSWARVPFETLFDVPSRNGVYKGKEFQGSGFKIVNMGELFGYEFISNQDMKLLQMTDKELERSGLLDGDLLFGRRSLVESGAGKCSIVVSPNEPMTFESSIIRVRLDKQTCNPLFYYYWFKSHVGRAGIKAIVTGTNVKGIRGSDLKNVLVAHPEIDVQNRVVEICKSYDDLIENNRRRIQLLEESARLLYQEWFVHLRIPGHEHVEIVDGVPEGWEPTFLPDVVDVNPKERIPKDHEAWYVPMASLSETSMTADPKYFERRTKHTTVKFRRNDTLLARITPCLENGKTGFAYFLKEDEVACGSTEFIVLRGNKVSAEFTYCLARSYPFRETAINSMTGSSGRQRVQVSCLNEYRVPLPPSHLLNEFDKVVRDNFVQIRLLMEQNTRLEQARDLLLPRLMNGEIAV